jgi:hypothetical protein
MSVPTHRNGAHPNGTAPNPTPAPDATPQAGEGQRDAQGRFASGNRGGPGNPFARQVATLRQGLLARLTPEDLGDVAEALLRQAKEGNVAAAKLLLSYSLGKPLQTADPDTLDLHEWELYQRLPDPGPEMLAATTRPGLPFALEYLRTVLPGVADDQLRQFAEAAAARKAEEELEASARAERAARRQARQAEKAAAKQPGEPPASPAPASEAAAVDRLARLLGMGPDGAPSANGGAAAEAPWRLVPPPSANGGAPPHPGRDEVRGYDSWVRPGRARSESSSGGSGARCRRLLRCATCAAPTAATARHTRPTRAKRLALRPYSSSDGDVTLLGSRHRRRPAAAEGSSLSPSRSFPRRAGRVLRPRSGARSGPPGRGSRTG